MRSTSMPLRRAPDPFSPAAAGTRTQSYATALGCLYEAYHKFICLGYAKWLIIFYTWHDVLRPLKWRPGQVPPPCAPSPNYATDSITWYSWSRLWPLCAIVCYIHRSNDKEKYFSHGQPGEGLVTRVPYRPTHEKQMPFNNLKTNYVDKGEKWHAQSTHIT